MPPELIARNPEGTRKILKQSADRKTIPPILRTGE